MFMRSRGLLLSSVCVLVTLVSVQLSAQSFAPAVPYGSAGNGANAVAMADVNGDGIPDLVVANWCADATIPCPASSVGVLLGNGDGTFKTAVVYPSGGLYSDSVAVADFNGDGKPDIVVGNCGFTKITTCDLASNGNVAVLLNAGNGTFGSAVPYSLGTNIGAASVAVADLTGNGTLDLIVAAGSAGSSTVEVLMGNGDGTFKAAVPYNSGGFTALSVAIADVNGDNKPDLVVANWCTDNTCVASSVGVLLGNGDGTFPAAVTYPSGGFLANSVAIGDVNGDGKPDVVVGNGNTSTTVAAGNVGVLLGNGNGTFQTAVAYSRAGVGATSVVISDVNGDGKLDLAVANCGTTGMGCGNADGDLVTLLGNGDGTFQAPVSYGSGGNTPFGLVVGDVNGDGRPDLVAANCVSNQCGAGPGEVGVLLNTTLTATATALTSSPNPSQLGQAVTLTATVTAQPGFDKSTPTGTVNFLNGTASIGSSPLNGSGVATLAISTLPGGTDSITATYSEDTNFASSTSPGLQQSVQGSPNYTLSANPTSATVNPGSAANYVITLTPSNGYDGTVTINCPSTLPAGVTCNTPSIGPGKTTATLTINTTGPRAALFAPPDVNLHQGPSNLWASFGGVGLVGIILAGDWKKRNRLGMRIMFGILAVIMILALVGCGGSSSSGSGGGGGGTPAGTYQLQVTATGTAGTNGGSTAAHPLPLTLIVN
jgi:hypothetical protein